MKPEQLEIARLKREVTKLKPQLHTGAVTTHSIQLVAALLATGRFLAILSRSALRLSGKRLGLRALPVNLHLRSGPVGIVTLKNRTLSPASELFIDCAREIAKPLIRSV